MGLTPAVPASVSRKRLQFPPVSHIQPLWSRDTALLLPSWQQGWAPGVPAAPLHLGPQQLHLCRAAVRTAGTLHQKANSKKANTITRQLKCSSNKQTLCNEDLGLCSCQQVQQVLHIKSSLDLLAPKREMPQRSCHLRFHISPPFLHPTTLLPFLSSWLECIFTPF